MEKLLSNSRPIVCKLTRPELQVRKKTILHELRSVILGKVEISNGFQYKFPATDTVIDQVTNFIKTERLCCDFLIFSMTVSDERDFLWLELSGAEGSKEFIQHEIGL